MDQTSMAHTSEVPEEVVMTLEFVTAGQESDPALVNAVGRETAETLRLQGYTLRPVHTEQKEKGGGFLIEVVITITQLAATAWDHRAVAEEVIADLSGLIAIFGAIVPALKQAFHAHERQVGKQESVDSPISIALEIDGAPLLVTAPDVAQLEAALKLAQRFCASHPTVARQVTSKSKVKAQGRVPARKRRPRR
jgi:N-acetyl-anhydromuramyl-L-alanine amidase AmpD